MPGLSARHSLERLLTNHPRALTRMAAALQVLTGIVLIVVVVNVLMSG